METGEDYIAKPPQMTGIFLQDMKYDADCADRLAMI